MIVKNEAHVIARALESVLPLVDCVCVCDTGSTDTTEEAFWDMVEPQCVEAEFVHHAWVNFGANRTLAFREAERLHKLTADDWHLVIDADDALDLRVTPKSLRLALETQPHDSWSLEVHHDGTRYRRLHFFRADGTWTYKGPAHEHPHRTHGEANTGELHPEAIIYRFLGGGASHLQPQAEKYSAHAALFQAALDEDPTDSRSAFYLAQSLKDAGHYEEAIKAYWTRADMQGWDQERYYSLLQAGRLHRLPGMKDFYARAAFFRAFVLDPTRAEAPFELAKYLADCVPGAREEALAWAEVAASRPAPSDQSLFVEPCAWALSRNLAAQLRAAFAV